MSAILYAIIHKKADLTYVGPEISAANYSIWVKHWFASAAELAEEFEQRDLPATAQAIRLIILEQRKLVNYEC